MHSHPHAHARARLHPAHASCLLAPPRPSPRPSSPLLPVQVSSKECAFLCHAKRLPLAVLPYVPQHAKRSINQLAFTLVTGLQVRGRGALGTGRVCACLRAHRGAAAAGMTGRVLQAGSAQCACAWSTLTPVRTSGLHLGHARVRVCRRACPPPSTPSSNQHAASSPLHGTTPHPYCSHPAAPARRACRHRPPAAAARRGRRQPRPRGLRL